LHLSFFSTKVTKPEKIRRIHELIEKSKLARTTGGTNFHCIFENIKLYFPNHPPKLIIILTDGYSFYPEENETHGIPVIWGINNLDATPPFGKIIRIGR
jgi:predicted metal-dependent peptidase